MENIFFDVDSLL